MVECPECKFQFAVNVIAGLSESQKCKATITSEKPTLFNAREIGEIIVSMAKAMEATAKASGEKLEVVLVGSTIEESKVVVEFAFIQATVLKKKARNKKEQPCTAQ